MPDRPITAALGAVATIVAGILACLVLALALHLPASRAGPPPPPTTTATTTTVSPAAPAPDEYVPTPAGPPTTKP
jgi:hypothetical protein